MKLFLCGDVMTARGIDQVLPHPSDPVLHEGYVDSALGYVRLAEERNGPIPRPADAACGHHVAAQEQLQGAGALPCAGCFRIAMTSSSSTWWKSR